MPVDDRMGSAMAVRHLGVNDLIALGVLQAMFAAGIRVPEEIAIVGYDDIEFAAGAAVPLSSVRQPAFRIGRRAGDLLVDKIRQGAAHSHQQVVFQPELVVRRSSMARRAAADQHGS